MKKTRYIIVDEELGVFLGTYNGEDLGHDDNRIYACFAANNPFALTTACSFPTKNVANYFIRDTFHPRRRPSLNVLSVECESEFPNVVEIIKSGYEEFTHDMTEILFETTSQTLH